MSDLEGLIAAMERLAREADRVPEDHDYCPVGAVHKADLRRCAEAGRMLGKLAKIEATVHGTPPDLGPDRCAHCKQPVVKAIHHEPGCCATANYSPKKTDKAQASEVLGAGSVADAGSASPEAAVAGGTTEDADAREAFEILAGALNGGVVVGSLAGVAREVAAIAARDHAIAEGARRLRIECNRHGWLSDPASEAMLDLFALIDERHERRGHSQAGGGVGTDHHCLAQ